MNSFSHPKCAESSRKKDCVRAATQSLLTFNGAAVRIPAQEDNANTEIRLSAEEVIETTKQAVLNMDLPSLDGINSYIVAKQVASRGFKVALAGVGGDELFGGYSPFRFLSRLKYLAL